MIEIDVLPASEKQSADAILLRIGSFSYDNTKKNNQKVILIDSGWQSTAEKIENHLNDYYYTDTIDYVFITHPDRDHISGLLELLENKNIKISRTFIHDPWNYKNKLLKRSKDGRRTINSINSRLDENLDILSRILDLLDERKIINNEIFGVSDSDKFGLSELGLYVLGPSKDDYVQLLSEFPGIDEERNTSNKSVYTDKEFDYNPSFRHFLSNPVTSAKNDSSMIILLHNNKKEPIALFTGDAGVESIYKALKEAEYEELEYKNVALMQLPHHGSIKNINQDIIDSINPRKIFVSASDEDNEHPSKLVVNYIINRGIPIKHIGSSGGIVYYFDGAENRPGWYPAPNMRAFTKVQKIKEGY